MHNYHFICVLTSDLFLQFNVSGIILKCIRDYLSLLFKIAPASTVKQFCKSNDIIFQYKIGANKASFAEWIIMVLKRRLYKILRDKKTVGLFFLLFNCLLGPFNFTIVNIKEGPAIPHSASCSSGSCLFLQLLPFL